MSALATVIVFVDLLAFGFVGPLIPLHVRALGGDARSAGLLVSVFSLTSLVSLPLLGRLSDRIGRRAVIALSLAGNALTLLAFACAIRIGSLWLLFASRAIAGAVAGNVTTCQSVVADVSASGASGDGARRLGHVSAAMGLGLMIGPGIGSALHAFGGWVPPLAAAILTLVDLAAVVLLLPETRDPATPSHAPRASTRSERGTVTRAIAVVLALHFVAFFCMANLQAVLPLFLAARLAWGAREIGILFALSGLLTLILQGGLLGPLARAFGARSLVAGGAGLIAAAMMALALARGPLPLVASLAVVGVGLGLALPMLAQCAVDAAALEQRGAVLGFAQSAGGLARTVGPIAAGTLFDLAGPSGPFAICAALAALSVVLTGWLDGAASVARAESEAQ